LISKSDLHALASTLREIRTKTGSYLMTDRRDTRDDEVVPLATLALSHMMRMCDDTLTKFKEATELLEERTRELSTLKATIGSLLQGK
jgi:hypothetical protein